MCGSKLSHFNLYEKGTMPTDNTAALYTKPISDYHAYQTEMQS